MKRNPSLNELMGSAGSLMEDDEAEIEGFDFEDLKELLGEKMPKIEFTPVGRLRLINALQVRFGNGFRSLPGVQSLLKKFDEEAAFNVKMHEMKMIRGAKSTKKESD